MRYSGNNIKLMVNDMMVNYTDAGPEEAPVIIFIHGFPLNLTMWNKQIEVLKDNYRVIAYDIRGHGESDAGNESFSIDLFVSDLIRFMNSLKITKASICGLSMGGYIALNAIENYPERFEGLVLCDTSCMADTPEAKERRMKAIENIIKNGVMNYAGESIKNLFAPESFATKVAEVSAVKEMIVNTPEFSLCSTLLALSARHETCTGLPELNVPVLVIVGEHDGITPLSVSHIMLEKIKGAALQVVGHAGHLSNLENPEVFNSYIKKFLDGVYKEHFNDKHSGGSSFLKELHSKLNMFLSFRSI